MTPIELLLSLETFLLEETKDLLLSVQPMEGDLTPAPRPAEIHKMQLPVPEERVNRIPYTLLQLVTGKDEEPPVTGPESECRVRLVFATYGEDAAKGMMELLNLVTRVRYALLRTVEVGDYFLLQKPLEYHIYLDQTPPYYFAEMMTIWEMPPIKREETMYDE